MTEYIAPGVNGIVVSVKIALAMTVQLRHDLGGSGRFHHGGYYFDLATARFRYNGFGMRLRRTLRKLERQDC